MSTEVLHSRQQRLREAAILVASLDDQLAERLVDSMPPEDAAAVRMAVAQLGSVVPDEQDEIVAKFRQSTEIQQPASGGGVELDASLLARLDEHDLYGSQPEQAVASDPLEKLSPEEMATVVSMLSAEHPQTISVVLARLNPTNAADLLSNFSPTVQADVLTRMANCESADEEAVRAVESQLGQWIDQHRQQRQRMAAGLDLVQRIFSSTSQSQQDSVLTQLKGTNPHLAGRLDRIPTASPNPIVNAYQSTTHSAAEDNKPVERETPHSVAEPRRFDKAKLPLTDRTTVPPSPARVASNHPIKQLDQLDDTTLMLALSQTDRQVVTLALAGASDGLMKRVLRGLPRRHASKLRKQLRNIGPTRLSDMLAAQEQLLHSAHQILSQQ